MGGGVRPEPAGDMMLGCIISHIIDLDLARPSALAASSIRHALLPELRQRHGTGGCA